MIETSALCKSYYGRLAVDRLDFSVEKGETVGFLGPNGAGKSTTLKMLTCFLAPSSGTATVGGHSIREDALKVQQTVGYMPENVPLYPDMRVTEYLEFRGRLKGLRHRDCRRRMAEVMDLCDLTEVSRKMIGALSKGFRQRVGLADALIHRPELLILDEPTNGLDPNQIRQARDLIRRLGEEYTVLVSTHILSEVEKISDRVVIIDRGKIRASESPKSLVRRRCQQEELRVELKATEKQVETLIEGLSKVELSSCESLPGEWLEVTLRTTGSKDQRETIATAIQEKGWPLRELASRTASLEDAFLEVVSAPRKNH